MAKVILTTDGQEFDIEDEIAADDDLLKSVLKSSYPQLGDPELKRENKNGLMTVRVTKRAGPKGSAVLDELKAAGAVENPGVEINRRLDSLRARPFGPKAFVVRVTKMEGDIIAALQVAKEDSKAVAATSASLRAAVGEHALFVPVGF
jgi:hypothetical protein